MGRWLADFLASQGFRITIADPAGAIAGYRWLADWRDSRLDHDLIVVATPLGWRAACCASSRRAGHAAWCSTSAR